MSEWGIAEDFEFFGEIWETKCEEFFGLSDRGMGGRDGIRRGGLDIVLGKTPN